MIRAEVAQGLGGLPECGDARYGNVVVNGLSLASTRSLIFWPLLHATVRSVSVTSSASARPLGKCESALVWPWLMLMRKRSAALVPLGASRPTMSVRPAAGVGAQLACSTRLSSLGTSGSRM